MAEGEADIIPVEGQGVLGEVETEPATIQQHLQVVLIPAEVGVGAVGYLLGPMVVQVVQA
ncbi:MAG: hypothetical protein EBS69_08505 [Verrucomicrobia bacterium]|nr:hypothetical protein [Verrucomicrobiota bacterium]